MRHCWLGAIIGSAPQQIIGCWSTGRQLLIIVLVKPADKPIITLELLDAWCAAWSVIGCWPIAAELGQRCMPAPHDEDKPAAMSSHPVMHQTHNA